MINKLLLFISLLSFQHCLVAEKLAPPTSATESTVEVPTQKDRKLIGWVEEIKLSDSGLYLDAKITPGTLGNSLNGENILADHEVKKVSFEVEDKTGKREKFTKRYKAYKNGKYYLKFKICIDHQVLELDFKVSNRSDFNQPARIGRDSIAGLFIVDPASVKLTKPEC